MLSQAWPPKEVSAGRGDRQTTNVVDRQTMIDIRHFPAQRMWPLDGGKYLGTYAMPWSPRIRRAAASMSACYRMMIKGPREIGLLYVAGKRTLTILPRQMVETRQAFMPVAAAFGIDPLLFLVSGDEHSQERRASTTY